MKDKSTLIFGIVLGAFIIIFTLIFWFQPKKVDWTETFHEKDKNPYGDFVLYERMKDLFPNQKIEKTKRTLYEELDYFSYDDEQKEKDGNYVFITNSLEIDTYDLEALLKYVAEGNTVFMAASHFSYTFSDTLKFKLGHSYYDTELTKEDFNINKSDALSLNFVNPTLKKKDNFYFKKGTVVNYFETIDSNRTTILGLNSLNQITFIKINHEKGAFLISTTPLAFTNYNMLYRQNDEYIERAFSYLPEKNMYWDTYYKPFKSQLREGELAFVMNQAPLKWAWYLTICTVILYVIFNMKRVQRIIPVLLPAKNSTLEFVKTVSSMYYQRKNHQDLARKKISFFYDYIRTYYYLNPSEQDDAFFRKLGGKMGKNESEIRQFFEYLNTIYQTDISEKELKTLNERLNDFKNGRK